jgi:GNAT superfamily N-acetyltransferase
MGVRIERLAAHHDHQRFDCGDTALNEFLRQHAGQQQRKGFGKTYVALSDNGAEILGFVTLSAGQIATVDLPESSRLPRHPAPVLRIGRLAVALAAQGKGVGQDLLAYALRIAIEFSGQVGLYAVVVDAKHERAAAFYRRIGFIATLDNPLCLFLPLATLRQTR